MTDLSPAAQAIWVAYLDHSKIDETPADLPALAAALDVLADQVVPEEPDGGMAPRWIRQSVRRQILAIAAELRGQDQPSSGTPLITSMTNQSRLCVDLVLLLEAAARDISVLAHSTDVSRAISSNALLKEVDRVRDILRRADLAQTEPEVPTDEELEATARAAEIQYIKEHGGLTATTPDGIHAQLQAQRLAGLRAVAARWGQ